MIAGSILAAGAGALLTSYNTLMGVAEHQRRLAIGVTTAKGKLEELLVASSTSPIITAGSGSTVVDAFGKPAGTLTNTTYQLNWTIEDDVPVAGFLRITVRSTWNETTRQRTTSFSTVRMD